jgi:hypothetical protein
VLCFFDDDRGLSWVSRRDQLLSCRWIRLLSLRLGQRVVILGSRPGLALGLASSPALVLLLAQPAVAVLRSACCDFFDHDRDLSWVSCRDQFLSCSCLSLLLLRFGQRFGILGSRPGLELGLSSRPDLVLLLAHPAVAALRSACCYSWITTGT